MRGHRPQDPKREVTTWREEELLDGETVETLVGILETRGCSHDRERGGCTMCGYAGDTPLRPPEDEELLAQVEHVASRRGEARWVKLYTSGSMLDPEEVPPAVLEVIVETFGDADMLTVESRAEHVTRHRVEALRDVPRREVAIGLESACDAVLSESVHKGMTLEGFRRAAGHVKDAGARLRAYVLLKPPFLTEAEAIEDSYEAALVAAHAGADVVSVNPVNIHGATMVDFLHYRGEYEPPWLWSVLRVLERAGRDLPEGARIVSAPTAGGKVRGAHNCGQCDKEVLTAIEFHRLSGDARELEGVQECGCRVRWQTQLELEGHQQGPFAPPGYRRG
ncbi:MAG: TIGR01210 family radical SAM protein [Thermoplasmata archaeon]|nr:TIGR01210 family radical SAM protein [Thermoplasmata archaeon]NIS11887.1 TIGR01210 family radical SAM protein [Thermoplasmata archaeon]NIS19781.1 TIGR01210 family radical SAM protein [Thermoplasmata archaeon]NIT76972.1 TIGR01210 family radical SAM protein [Thermoplasmata archaeon]NIU48892.1 TIGR01210 family radical SAM protein [Thermoplasmata archaeon]